jgi:hypothetical protein
MISYNKEDEINADQLLSLLEACKNISKENLDDKELLEANSSSLQIEDILDLSESSLTSKKAQVLEISQ